MKSAFLAELTQHHFIKRNAYAAGTEFAINFSALFFLMILDVFMFISSVDLVFFAK